MTPWQLKLCVESHMQNKNELHDHDTWIMWHLAALFRWPAKKKFPDIKEFMSGRDKKVRKKVAQKIDDNAIIARMKEYQRRKDKQNHGKSS